MKKSLYINDTICAIAASGGSIGIVRISGSESFRLVLEIFAAGKTKKKISAFQTHRIYYGHIVFNNEIIDEVILLPMQSPKSYTCEDVVEIHCHGGVKSLQRIMTALLSLGIRPAEQGEFTKRAFLNGRLDLSQAEAVMDIIAAKTELSHQTAVNQLSGGISGEIKEYRNIVLSMLANIEANIDYPENDIEELSIENIKHQTTGLIKKIKQLLKTSDTGRIIRDGIQTVIIGKPNVGKSSLLNMILNEERAIVTDIPGTTRDALHEYVDINNIPLKITDTAGIRETEDEIERIGVERSMAYARTADLILFVLDASTGLTDEDITLFEHTTGKKTIVLINKTDLENRIDNDALYKYIDRENVIEISAALQKGLDALADKLSQMFFGGEIKTNMAVVSSLRHKNALIRALSSLENVIATAESGLSQDFMAIDLTDAYSYLGEITGDSVDEDIIDRIFSDFCLGK